MRPVSGARFCLSTPARTCARRAGSRPGAVGRPRATVDLLVVGAGVRGGLLLGVREGAGKLSSVALRAVHEREDAGPRSRAPKSGRQTAASCA